MRGRPTVLTPDVFETLLKYIREGAWDWVAAESAGIGRSTFYRWLARGKRGEPLFADFADEVAHARGDARRVAEGRVYQQHTLSWLRLGPGRERADEPGWTAAVPPRAVEKPVDEEEAEQRALQAALARQLKRVDEGLAAGDQETGDGSLELGREAGDLATGSERDPTGPRPPTEEDDLKAIMALLGRRDDGARRPAERGSTVRPRRKAASADGRPKKRGKGRK